MKKISAVLAFAIIFIVLLVVVLNHQRTRNTTRRESMSAIQAGQREKLNRAASQEATKKEIIKIQLVRMIEEVIQRGEFNVEEERNRLERLEVSSLSTDELLELAGSADFQISSTESEIGKVVVNYIAENFSDKALHDDVNHLFQQVKTNMEDDTANRQLLRIFLGLEGEKHEGVLSGILDQLDEEINDDIAETVGVVAGSLNSLSLTGQMLDMLVTGNTKQKYACDIGLNQVSSERVIPLLAKYIDANPSKAGTALQTTVAITMLGNIASEYSSMSLKNLSEDDDPEISSAARKALAKLVTYNPGLEAAGETNK